MTEATVLKIPLRIRQFQERELAIIDETHVLLGSKGYELMTMDDVAIAVGIAKGSLYKHFPSKEKLAGAVMIRLFRRTLDELAALPGEMSALDRLKALLKWALEERIRGGVPHLPSTSKALQASLLSDPDYVQAMLATNTEVTLLIEAAREAGAFQPELPADFIMLTIYARTCDPTLDMLVQSGTHAKPRIVEMMLAACFDGLNAR
jgi:AcrR family transcriptional regulator